MRILLCRPLGDRGGRRVLASTRGLVQASDRRPEGSSSSSRSSARHVHAGLASRGRHRARLSQSPSCTYGARRMRALRLAFRFVHIAIVVTIAVLDYAFRRLGKGRLDRAGLEGLRGERLAALMERLGATFIKFGQIMSTRPDLLGPGYTQKLARLQDAVPPAPFTAVEAVIAHELSAEARARLVSIDPTPVAAASVAQVHKATLDTGEIVALKVQRPEAEAQIERDLAILGILARLVDRLPSVHLLSIPGAVDRFAESLRGQLDFRREAENNRRFAENFTSVPAVGVPRLFPDLCTRRVLGMEFVDGAKASDHERIRGDRKELARVGGKAILQMVFLDGFVHADLHPGNILLTDDRVILIDLGMVTEIPPDLRRPWVETFIALSQSDGVKAAELFYGYAPSVGETRYAEFERDVSENLGKLAGKSLGEVEVGEAVSGMMNVLRRHRVQVDPTFTVVHIALLVAEGLGKQLDPEIDMVGLAVPYLMQAMTAAPPARLPAREPPRALPA
ncbi:Ubiquinone biosynthesis monooxygenase UbiB [Minicystis rosea]|nr:Ubiquinone biosynthesis monooxygenase UbiB [Minicystis rosea]